jgi:hypothetical protein
MLLLRTHSLRVFAQLVWLQRGWTVTDGVIHFHKANAAGDEAGAQHLELINHTLVYAKELERIV